MAYKDPVQREMEELAELERLAGLENGGTEEENEDTDTPGEIPPDPEASDPSPENPTPNAPEQPVEGAEGQPKPDVWAERYRTLQGKYNSEVPRLQAEIAALREELQFRQNSPTYDTEDNTDPDAYRSPHVSDEVRRSRAYRKMAEEYGVEYAEMHCETAALAAKDEVKPVQTRLAESQKDRYHSQISALAPNWLALNDDPAFIEAMDSQRVYGQSLRELLNQAYAKGDAQAVADIFNNYEQQQRQPTDKAPKQPTAQQQAYVAPPKRGSAAQTTIDNNQGRIWSMSEVNSFYRDLELGVKYKGKEKEAAQIEAEIMKANAEGRIVS